MLQYIPSKNKIFTFNAILYYNEFLVKFSTFLVKYDSSGVKCRKVVLNVVVAEIIILTAIFMRFHNMICVIHTVNGQLRFA